MPKAIVKRQKFLFFINDFNEGKNSSFSCSAPKLLIIVKNYLGGVGGLFLKKIRIGTHKMVIIIA